MERGTLEPTGDQRWRGSGREAIAQLAGGGFALDLLDSLDVNIALLDGEGTVIAVNEAWRRFARDHGATSDSVGVNYLAVCRTAIRQGDDGGAEEVLKALGELLRGERERFSLEYPGHPPPGGAWFQVRLARFQHESETYVIAAHEDITERKLAKESLRDAKSTLRRVLESLPVGVWIVNEQGTIIHANSASLKIWGGAEYVGPEQFDEYRAWRLDGTGLKAEDWSVHRTLSEGKTVLDQELVIEAFDGKKKVIVCSSVPLLDAEGNISGAIVVNQDITERKRVEERLREATRAVDRVNQQLERVLERERSMARTDTLTGLSNRREFLELSRQLFSVARRYQTPLSIVLFDLDHFKQINDTYGHQVGDEVLKRVARVARQHTRDADVLARWGGEEFIVTLPNTIVRDALSVAESIRKHVLAGDENQGTKEVTVTISAGVAERRPEDEDLDAVIHRADLALYAAKHEGRNCSRIYSAGATPIAR